MNIVNSVNKKIFLIVFILCLTFAVAGCDSNSNTDDADKKYDADFMGIEWTRETEVDIEHLCFNTDGSLSYYCSCGEPVNDSDLIDSYSYDSEQQIITFNTQSKTATMITEVKVIEYDSEHIKLDFNGEIREFFVEK